MAKFIGFQEVFEEHSKCERLLSEAPGKKSTENELIDRLLADLDNEEDEGIAGAPSHASGVETTAGLSRSVRARRASSSFVTNTL